MAITVLGKTFESEKERREYFQEELRKKLPELKKMEGFPIGDDEDIIELSDPPYYTACPNPWLNQIDSGRNNKDVDKPYSKDFKVESRHPVYLFHPYHTKVPPSIISELISYYTNEDDIVLDVFAGSGMTGVAARELNRKIILNDLSTVSTFISAVNTTSFDLAAVIETTKEIIHDSKKELNWLYQTTFGNKKLDVNYFVWGDVFTCPECVHEFCIFPHGVNHNGNKVKTKKEFQCPSCGVNINVRKINRVITPEGKKKELVWVNAGRGNDRIKRKPIDHDHEVFNRVKELYYKWEKWYPEDKIDPQGYTAKLAQLGDKEISDISKLLSERNLIVYSDLWARMSDIANATTRNGVRALLTSIFTVISERQGYFGGGGGMSGNLYMPIVRMEKNVYDVLKRKLTKFKKSERSKPKSHLQHYVTTQSSTDLGNIENNSVDYIYTDPPFGANIIYSEMNLISEGWLRVKTNDRDESVIDETKGKHFFEYGNLMRECFKECFRTLKPGKWMTVEFHNTKASVWNLIQSSISEAGFVIAQVNKLDKGSTTILADIRPGAAVQDLIISCYKPSSEFDNKFSRSASKPVAVWDFIEEHLNHLPIHLKDGNHTVINLERTPRILYDRVIAFYLQKNLPVPIDAGAFQNEIRKHFIERDGMFFTNQQVQSYDQEKAKMPELSQLSILVSSEKDGILWLRNFLENRSMSYQKIQPEWLKASGGLRNGDIIPELRTILEENFLKNEDDKWYVPDPNKEEDLERLRNRRLLKQFEDYKEQAFKPKGKIKECRVEALRAGFKQSYQDKDFETIVRVGDRIPENLLMEDEVLLQFYDIAAGKV